MIVIDGTTFDVPVEYCHITGEFLDKYAERTEDGELHRELIGVYFNYQLRFGNDGDVAEFAALWLKLTEPVPFHTITIPYLSGDLTYTAYFSNIAADLRKAKDALRFWQDMTVNFIAKSPARVP